MDHANEACLHKLLKHDLQLNDEGAKESHWIRNGSSIVSSPGTLCIPYLLLTI